MENTLFTSSTAQGDGGRFKNRKHIGEVGCCESRMAERIHWWTERWLKLCFLEWLQWFQWSPHPQLLDEVWCSAVVVWSWQHQKRSNSARRPQFSKLTTSKMKQFCEASFKNGKLSAELTASYQCVLLFFHSTCLKYCACHEKVMPGHMKCCTCHAKYLSNLKIWCSKMQTLSGNRRPDLLTAPMNMSLVLRLPRKMHLCRSSAYVPRLPSFLKLLQNPHVLLTFDKVRNHRLPRKTTSERPKVLRAPQFFALWLRNMLRATTECTFSTSQLPKVLWTRQFFTPLTSKCASRHNGVHFFDIATSKSGPRQVCFVHIDFEMCFAPQRHALFRHQNF